MITFKQFITETALIPKSEYDPKRNEFNIDRVTAEARKNKKPLPGYDGYTYTITKDSNVTYINVFDDKNPDIFVGFLLIESLSDLPKDTFMSSQLMVHPDYRKQGIAKAMYKMFLEPPPKGLGKTLISDSVQTKGGQMIWASLAEIPGIEITGLIKLKKPTVHTLKIFPDIEKQLLDVGEDLFGKVGGVYLGENDAYYFYQIPVSAMGKKLENSIKKSKIKIYKNTWDYNTYESFLMAKM